MSKVSLFSPYNDNRILVTKIAAVVLFLFQLLQHKKLLHLLLLLLLLPFHDTCVVVAMDQSLLHHALIKTEKRKKKLKFLFWIKTVVLSARAFLPMRALVFCWCSGGGVRLMHGLHGQIKKKSKCHTHL